MSGFGKKIIMQLLYAENKRVKTYNSSAINKFFYNESYGIVF